MKPILFIILTSFSLLLSSCVSKDNKHIEQAPRVVLVANKSTIHISQHSSKKSNVVSSNLNHYTTLKVGTHKKQYAILIETDVEKMPVRKEWANNRSDGGEFGDEIIEDEIVEETIALPETKPIAAIDIVNKDSLSPKGNKTTSENVFSIQKINDTYLLGKFNPATHPDFTKIRKNHGSKKGMYLRKDAYIAFIKMYNAAKKDGINLKILSATRSFSSQKRIWEAKWTGRRKVAGKDLSKALPFGKDRAKKILEFSAMPGTSRHHWGTDIDLCALNNPYFESGKGKKIYEWLTIHAHKFGFDQPYTAQTSRENKGHNEEKWHWSYTPVSKLLTQKYTQILNNEKITGFKGEKSAPQIQIIENYVLGVSTECK